MEYQIIISMTVETAYRRPGVHMARTSPPDHRPLHDWHWGPSSFPHAHGLHAVNASTNTTTTTTTTFPFNGLFSRITWLADRSAQNVGDLRVSGAVHRSVATRVGSRQICTASDQVACYDQPVLSLQRRRQAQLNLTRTITESVSSRNHRRSSWHLLQARPGLPKEKQRKSLAVFTYQPDRWPTVAQPTRWKLWKRTRNTDSTTYHLHLSFPYPNR